MKNCFTACKKPLLYSKSEAAFWDDEYISKQMLKAHLNPDVDEASRKKAFIQQSINWISTIIPPSVYPTLLDVGCGPGIYAEAFTQKGYQVTGIDFSKRSIAYAKQSACHNRLDITYIYQDYLSMNLKQQYDFVTMIYCDYGALSTLDRQDLLTRIHKHLKPGGKLLLDVFSMKKYQDYQETQIWEAIQQKGFWRAEEHVVLNGYYKYTDTVTLDLITVLTKNDITAYYLWNTYFTKDTLIQEIERCGFQISHIYGDVAGNQDGPNSDTIAILAEKR